MIIQIEDMIINKINYNKDHYPNIIISQSLWLIIILKSMIKKRKTVILSRQTHIKVQKVILRKSKIMTSRHTANLRWKSFTLMKIVWTIAATGLPIKSTKIIIIRKKEDLISILKTTTQMIKWIILIIKNQVMISIPISLSKEDSIIRELIIIKICLHIRSSIQSWEDQVWENNPKDIGDPLKSKLERLWNTQFKKNLTNLEKKWEDYLKILA